MNAVIKSTVAVALGTALLGCALHAQSEAATAKQFVGIWRLASRVQRLADGTTRAASNSVAYIIYTDTGHMCYVGMDPRRPKWKVATTPTPEEAMSGIMGLGAYCATVEINAREGFVVHHVEIERVPNNVGEFRKRWFTFQGPDRVALRVDVPTPPIVEDTLIWERQK